MSFPKKKRSGRAERLALVTDYFGRDAFPSVRALYPTKAVADDDILDAFAALRTAERILRNQARCFPERVPRDSLGIPMEIVF